MRILEEIDEHLFELRRVEVACLARQPALDLESIGAPQFVDEDLPGGRGESRPGQLRKARIALDERIEMTQPVIDRIEHLVEQRRVGVRRQLAGRVRKRRDGRERVVELMRYDADDAFPG